MLEVFVTEIGIPEAYRHLRYIVFPLDGGKEFCHRSRISYNAFANSRTGRNYKTVNKVAVRLYHCETRIGKKRKSRWCRGSNAPTVEVASLWEFYELIGYDYKTQKWIEKG